MQGAQYLSARGLDTETARSLDETSPSSALNQNGYRSPGTRSAAAPLTPAVAAARGKVLSSTLWTA